MNGLFVVNLAVAWFLTGLIWTIQIVHYPLFGLVGDRFCEYERVHMRRIGYVVGPVMLLELLAATLLVWLRPVNVSISTAIASLGLIVIIWISTVTVQAPCHRRLSQGFDTNIERRLTTSNWIRTIAWTTRALLLAYATFATLG